MHKKNIFFVLLLITCPCAVFAQLPDRTEAIRARLTALSETVPGLKESVKLSVTGVSVQEFLRALAQANKLNINIDSKLNFQVYNNFTNESAQNILLFLAQEYHLDISLVGSIITVSQYQPQHILPPEKEIKASYNATENTLNLELDNDSLVLVARKISQISGKNIVVPEALLPKKVTAFFTDAPFDTALEKLAFANNIKMVKTSDNVYIFESLREREEVFVNQDKNTSVRQTFKPLTPGEGGNVGLFSRTLADGQKLISVDAVNAAIADLIRGASLEFNKNYFLYSELKGLITTRVSDMTFDNFLSSLFLSTDYTYRIENGVYLIGERRLEGLRTHRVVQLQNRSIDTVQAMIPSEWRKGVEIREFREQNTLLLSGSGPQIAEIELFIKQLDQLVPQILIEVTLIDVRKNRNVKTGITAGTKDSIKTGGTILPGLDYTLGSRSINDFLSRVGSVASINLGRVTPSFYVGLSALETNDNVDIRSVPKLSTLNGHSATLSIGSSRYYVTKTQNVFPSLTTPQSIFTEQYNKVEANLAITIRPVVSGDDQVTLNIKVDISDFIGIIPDNAPPPTSTSKFESIIRARNEDMIVLGGLERTEKSDGSTGVPLLSRIPVLKWLFSSKNKSSSKVVTIVFIKPTIIR
ncbi:MAG: type II secretion system protein GspD [Sphingobacteriaceae bacterium]